MDSRKREREVTVISVCGVLHSVGSSLSPLWKGHRQFTGQVAENFESRVCDDYIKKKERTIAHSTCKSVAVFGSGGGSFSAQQNHEEGSWPRDDNAETILPL